MHVTHGATMNGRIHTELKDNPSDTPIDVIQRTLALLDGTRRYSWCLWRLPQGIPFDRVDLRVWPQEYMQAAGSVERMTVEVRRFENGVPCQYVIGRPVRDGERIAQTVIPWDGYEARVVSNEVFSLDEAVELFATYFETGGVDDTDNLRLLELGDAS